MTCSDLLKECRKCFAGLIFLWWGAIEDIPKGWQACDGTNGTPDLRNRHIGGAGDNWPPHMKGGFKWHWHEFYMGSHRHYVKTGTFVDAALGRTTTATLENPYAVTNILQNQPPYKALYFITRIPQET